MCNQQSLRSSCANAQSDQSLCLLLVYSMTVKLLTEHHLEFLSLKEGCTGSSESTLVKMPNCWKSHATAQILPDVFMCLPDCVSLHVCVLSSCICIWALMRENMSLGVLTRQGFSSNFGKRPLAKIVKKMIDFTSKLGEINYIEHNKGSKIYPQNQVILDCIMPTISLKHKCLSIILIWVIVYHK